MLEPHATKVQFPDDAGGDMGPGGDDGESASGSGAHQASHDGDAAVGEVADAAHETLRHICSEATIALPASQPCSRPLSRLSLLEIEQDSAMSSRGLSSSPVTPQHTEHTYFSDDDADVIIRSSDNVLLRMYKVILSKDPKP